ncbi:MAG: hypothetical protein ACKOEX_14060 [Planctomycetia bacterium]
MTHTVHVPPRLSIVIPMTSTSTALEETLVSVLENRPDDCEIVVVLSRPYADPWNIGEEVRFVQAPTGANIVSCVNLGIAASEASVIHVLAAGWRATPGWTDAAVAILEAGEAGAVVPVASDGNHTVPTGVRYGRGGRRIASSRSPMAPCLEAGFWRADIVEMAGRGFVLTCGEAFADADMAVTLDRMGCQVVVEPSAQVVRGEPRRRGNPFMAGLHAERLFWRSLAGRAVAPAVCMHAVEIVRHTLARAPLGMVPVLAGRLVAMLQFGAYRERYQQLRRLSEARAVEADGHHTIRIDAPHGSVGRPAAIDREIVQPMRRSA